MILKWSKNFQENHYLKIAILWGERGIDSGSGIAKRFKDPALFTIDQTQFYP